MRERRVERIHGRVDALLGDRAGEHRRGVQVGERGRRGRVGQVVGGDVDGLHRRDRALGRRGDALLQLAHLGRKRRLVAHGARHAAEKRGDFGARLDEAEDVVDEEQHVRPPSSRKYSAIVRPVSPTRRRAPGRLVHLAVDERGLADTPDPVISRQRSLPSRVRSPTPANTERPPCSWRCCGSAP